MKRQTIIYCGTRGILTQVFEKFVHALAYRIVFADGTDELCAVLERDPEAVIILAQAEPPDQLLDMARAIRTCGESQIFILADEPFEVSLPAIEVLPRTQGLSSILKRM